MLLTKSQQFRFWREWSDACKVQGWTKANGFTPAQIDKERHNVILNATTCESLKFVTRDKGFTALLEALSVLKNDLNGVVRAQQNERRQLLHAVRLAPAGYWQALATDRFGTIDLESLTDEQLTQLRNTIADRCVENHSPATLKARNARARSRRAAPKPEPRIQFPDMQQPASDIDGTDSELVGTLSTASQIEDPNPF